MRRFITLLLILLTNLLITAQNVESQTKFVQAEGVNLKYTVIGEGKPVLIINGGPGFNSEGFRPLAEKISEMGMMSILFDQRGTGQSAMDVINTGNMTIDLMVTDIEAIREDLSIEKWIVLGHSFGGMLGSYYTSLHQDRVAGLILSSSGGLDLNLLGETASIIESKLTSSDVDSLRYWRARFGESQNVSDQKKLNYYLSKAYVKNPQYYETVSKRLGQGNMELNRLVWQNLRSIGFDLKNYFSNYHLPVLILQGEDDILSKTVAKTSHETFKNSELIFIENSAHYGWLDNPEQYFTTIENFLDKINL